jgi:hypothetical protein
VLPLVLTCVGPSVMLKVWLATELALSLSTQTTPKENYCCTAEHSTSTHYCLLVLNVLSRKTVSKRVCALQRLNRLNYLWTAILKLALFRVVNLVIIFLYDLMLVVGGTIKIKSLMRCKICERAVACCNS